MRMHKPAELNVQSRGCFLLDSFGWQQRGTERQQRLGVPELHLQTISRPHATRWSAVPNEL